MCERRSHEVASRKVRSFETYVVMISCTWLRNLNVEEAKTMMIDTLRWREEFNIEGAINETFPDIFDGFGHLYGRDKEGRPIWYAVLSLPVLVFLRI